MFKKLKIFSTPPVCKKRNEIEEAATDCGWISKGICLARPPAKLLAGGNKLGTQCSHRKIDEDSEEFQNKSFLLKETSSHILFM